MTIRSFQYQVQALITKSGGAEITRSVTHADIVSDEGYVGLQQSVSSALALVDSAVWIYSPFDGEVVEHELGLADEALSLLHPTVEHELGLTDEVDVRKPTALEEVDPLILTQEAVFGFLVKTESIEHELGLVQEVRQAIPLNVSHTLDLTDQAIWLNVEDVLALTDEAEWGYGFDIEQDVDLTQATAKIQVLNKSVQHTNVVSQAAAWYVENRCNRLKFKTFHGEGGVAPQAAKLNYDSTFLFQSLVDGEIVTLRNPQTDDRRRYSFNRANRDFFDGSLDLFAEDDWVTEQRQLYTIVALKRTSLDTLHAFLESNLGMEILLKDWRGVTWRVVVLNPGEIYTEDGEGYWTLDFEVVGTALDGEFVFQKIELSDELSRAGSIWTRSATDAVSIVDSAGRNYDNSPADATALTSDASYAIVTP